MNDKQLVKYKKHLDVKNANYSRNCDYYNGNNTAILKDRNVDEYGRTKKQDRRIPLPIARKLINTVVGFQFSDIQYDETGKSLNDTVTFKDLANSINTEIEIEEKTDYLKYIESINSYNDNDILTLQTAIEACNHGRAYKIFYFSGDMLRIDTIPSNQIYPIYTDTLNPMLEQAIRFYSEKILDTDGQEKEIFHADVYTANEITKYKAEQPDYSDAKEDSVETYNIKKMHVVEYSIFRDKKPLIEHAYGMIDEADRILSKNIAEELAGVKSAILLMSANLDKIYKDDQGKTAYDRFMDTNIIENFMKDSDYASWLTKEIQDSFIFGAYDRLIKDIFELCDIPNFSDGESWGNQISGVSAGYRLLGFLFLCSQTFRIFSEGLRQEIDIANAYIEVLSNNSKIKSQINEIKITANKVLPKNLYENAQIASLLKGVVSKKTLYKLFPEIVSEADAEYEATEEEATEATQRLVGGLSEKPQKEVKTNGLQRKEETKKTEEVVKDKVNA